MTTELDENVDLLLYDPETASPPVGRDMLANLILLLTRPVWLQKYQSTLSSM
jgi:hypothetical protein